MPSFTVQTIVLLSKPHKHQPEHIDTSEKDAELLDRAPAVAAAAQQVIRFVDGGARDDVAGLGAAPAA